MDAKLVVFDSAQQHFNVTMGSGQQVRQALTPLKALLERTNCAAVFIDHLVKRPKANSHPLEALSGAGSGLPAAARFVYVFGRHAGDPNERILAPVKVNAIRADRSFAYEMSDAAVFTKDGKTVEIGRLVYVSDDSDVDASQVIAFNGGGKAADSKHGIKGAIAQEWLIGALMFGEKDAKEVQDDGADTGFSWRTLQRAGEAVGIVRKREGFGKGSKITWRLPDDHPALAMAAAMQAAGPAPAGS
jgi:putative DNA primase/helicase